MYHFYVAYFLLANICRMLNDEINFGYVYDKHVSKKLSCATHKEGNHAMPIETLANIIRISDFELQTGACISRRIRAPVGSSSSLPCKPDDVRQYLRRLQLLKQKSFWRQSG